MIDGGATTARSMDRAHLHRFRQLIADLGADCYVALLDETVVGLVHVTYARHLLDRQRATVELLLLAPNGHGREVGGTLARLVVERARRRNCRFIDWREPVGDETARACADQVGAQPVGDRLRVEIPRTAE
jgi:GNAT superfamily N-acetyltransferase